MLVPRAATGKTKSGERPFVDRFLYPTVGAVIAAAVTAGITYYVVKQSNERTTKDEHDYEGSCRLELLTRTPAVRPAGPAAAIESSSGSS